MKKLIWIAALALSGCAAGAFGDAVVYKQNVDDFYTLPNASLFAASGGPLQVYGTPPGGAGPQDVAAAIRLPAYLSPREVTAVPPGEDGLRLALVFGPAMGASSEQVCAGRVKGGASGPNVTRVFGVFCSGRRRAVSEGLLEMKGAPAPGDPAFTAGMDVLMSTLFPPVAPEDQDAADGCRRPKCG